MEGARQQFGSALLGSFSPCDAQILDFPNLLFEFDYENKGFIIIINFLLTIVFYLG